MKNLINIDFTVVRKRLASWIVLAILILFLTIGYVATYFSIGQFPFGMMILLPRHVFEYSLYNLNSNGILTAVIMGGLFFGSPFSWGTYSTRLTQRDSRGRIFSGKLIVALMVLLAWLVFGLIVGHIISFSLGFIEGSIVYRTPGFWPVVRGSLLTLLIWSTWFMLGGTLSLLSRSTAMGVGAGLAYYFLESVFVFAIPGFSKLVEGYRYLFIGQSTSAVSANLFRFEFFQGRGPSDFGLLTGAIVLICYLVALVLVSWWRFNSMQFPE